jgi:hypothetical protein
MTSLLLYIYNYIGIHVYMHLKVSVTLQSEDTLGKMEPVITAVFSLLQGFHLSFQPESHQLLGKKGREYYPAEMAAATISPVPSRF